jgi:filamentous hemagglutinin
VAALSVLVAAGVTIGPEVYAYCAVNSAACANAVTELMDCTVTVACTSTAGGVLSLGAATKVAGELEQSATAAARTAGTRTIIASDGTSVVVPAGYRPVTAAANDVGGLPTGYVRVIDDAGDVVIAGPNGAIYNDVAAAQKAATIGTTGTNSSLNIPGRVQSRVNLANGSTRYTPLNDAGNPVASGWDHVVSRHFGGTNTQSQFTLSEAEVRGILQSDRVVSTPISEIKMINGTPTYVRTVDVEQIVGTVRQSQGGSTTSRIMVQTDSAGNFITAYPVP